MAPHDADANLALKTFGQLREHFSRARMQPVRVGEGNTRTRPVGRQFAPQDFKHGAAAGGIAQFVTAAFDQ